MWAVPCFFMITGALLLGKPIEYPVIIKKYILRVFYALVLFGFPFGLVKVFLESKVISMEMILNAFRLIIEGKSSTPLWYLYTLIGLYFCLPVLNKITELPDKTWKGFLLSLFSFDFIIPFISNVTGTEIAFHIPITYPFFYVLMGYYLKNKKINLFENAAVRILGIIAIPLIIVLTCIFDICSAEIVAYDSPVIALYSVVVFSLFVSQKKDRLKDWIWNIDRHCFGVYLIHMVIIQFLFRFLKLTPVRYNHYIGATIIIYCGILIGSFLGSYILGLIRPLKKNVL